MKKKVLVSACLLGKNCRYDGGNSFINELDNMDVEWIPVCPEEAGGLGTPRPKAELQSNAEEIITGKGKVIDINGKDVRKEFIRGANFCLRTGIRADVDFAILKTRSPSCGVGKVYDGSFNGTLRNGNGVFAHVCQKSGIKIISSEDLDGIKKNLPKRK